MIVNKLRVYFKPSILHAQPFQNFVHRSWCFSPKIKYLMRIYIPVIYNNPQNRLDFVHAGRRFLLGVVGPLLGHPCLGPSSVVSWLEKRTIKKRRQIYQWRPGCTIEITRMLACCYKVMNFKRYIFWRSGSLEISVMDVRQALYSEKRFPGSRWGSSLPTFWWLVRRFNHWVTKTEMVS